MTALLAINMSKGMIITIIVLVVLIAITITLYFLGKKAQKRQEEQQAQIEQYKQNVSMLIIDKKKMRLKEAGLPQAVVDQTPKLMRNQKLPIVKAKVGPQIMSLICDEKIFNEIPVKKEVKAVVSGIYITGFKSLHGKNTVVADSKKKKGFKAWVERMQEKAGAKAIK